MPSEWKVSSNLINGAEKIYQVFRVLDCSKTDENGNREYLPGIYHDRRDAQMCANRLNKINYGG